MVLLRSRGGGKCRPVCVHVSTTAPPRLSSLSLLLVILSGGCRAASHLQLHACSTSTAPINSNSTAVTPVEMMVLPCLFLAQRELLFI